uniref:Lipoprotein n=1 Tax=uncultured delta proteobacterium TaxID=34034 RepID=H5SJF3_9DELT|nr:hypothetical protein HGMM_F36A01C24 [uncultured delta proteobacterium]
MVQRKYLALVSVLTGAVSVGCSDATRPADGGTDGGTEKTYTYVLSSLTIDRDDSGPKHGFNLDNLFSNAAVPSDCNHEDHFARYPEDNDQNCPRVNSDNTCAVTPNPGCAMGAPGCRGGVDNQLPAIADAIEAATSMDVRQLLNETVTQNKFALIVRITGVNNLMNDDRVRLFLYRGFPTFSTNCNTVEPGRTYQIDQASLRSGGTTLDDAQFAFDGRIVNGRLQVTAPTGSIDLPLPEVRGQRITLTLQSPQVRVNLTDTEGRSGNLGGAVSGNQLRDTVVRFAPDYASQVNTLLGSVVDIEAMGVCVDNTTNPPRYGNIGLGLGFTMVEARIAETNTFATSQMPGTCGYSSPSDGGRD